MPYPQHSHGARNTKWKQKKSTGKEHGLRTPKSLVRGTREFLRIYILHHSMETDNHTSDYFEHESCMADYALLRNRDYYDWVINYKAITMIKLKGLQAEQLTSWILGSSQLSTVAFRQTEFTTALKISETRDQIEKGDVSPKSRSSHIHKGKTKLNGKLLLQCFSSMYDITRWQPIRSKFPAMLQRWWCLSMIRLKCDKS